MHDSGHEHHGHQHGHAEHQHQHEPKRRKLHHDWRLWAVVLMLGAMAVYVMTMDESLAPGGDGQKQPAAAGP
jgi:hypothetical protein